MKNINWGCPPKLSPTDRRRIVFSVTAGRTKNAVKPPTSSSTPPYPHLSLPSLWYAEVCIYEGYSQEDEAPLSYQKVNGEWHGKVVLTWCTQHFSCISGVVCILCTISSFTYQYKISLFAQQCHVASSNPDTKLESFVHSAEHNIAAQPQPASSHYHHCQPPHFKFSIPHLPPPPPPSRSITTR